MKYLQAILFLISIVGTYLILTEYIILPSWKTEKVFSINQASKNSNWLDHLSKPLAIKVEPFVIMDSYKREKLDHTLMTIRLEQTAVQYTASAIAQAIVIAAVGIPAMLVEPAFILLSIVIAVFGYFKTMKNPDKLLKVKRERIELELPRFASTISNSLTASRDVVKILEQYRRVCGAELAGELDVTLADMKTGNLQNALRNFEGRLGSAKLSELIRGLLSVLHGEDQTLYFKIKNVEFRKEYFEMKKREIQLRPSKLNGYKYSIFALYLIMVLYVIGYQIIAGSSFLH